MLMRGKKKKGLAIPCLILNYACNVLQLGMQNVS